MHATHFPVQAYGLGFTRGLSDATVIRESPTISDVYYLKSTRCGGGVAPAIVSGYKTCLRADPTPLTANLAPVGHAVRGTVGTLGVTGGGFDAVCVCVDGK